MSSFRRPIQLIPQPTGAYVLGRYQPLPRPAAITILASVQPASGKDMQSLPENRRSGFAYRLFTDYPLHTAEAGAANSDIVVINGEEFEVISSEPWQNGVINHFTGLVVRSLPELAGGVPPSGPGLVIGDDVPVGAP